jgi:hypothetical protein
MDPMPGEFALAAADRGMGDFRHGVCPHTSTGCIVPCRRRLSIAD